MPENNYALEDTTPAEKISGEIGGSLKSISTMDTLDEQTKKQIEEQIANLTASTLSSLGSDMDPSKIKENTDILKSLGSKGFAVAKEAIETLNTVIKETTGMDINTILQGVEGASKIAKGLTSMDVNKMIDGGSQLASATSETALNGAATNLGLKEFLAKNSNFGQGEQKEAQQETIYGLTPEQLRPISGKQGTVDVPAILKERPQEEKNTLLTGTEALVAKLGAER